jgi:hypothetical protein
MPHPGRFTPPPERQPVLTVHKAGWVPGMVWMGVEIQAPMGTPSPCNIQHVMSRYTDYTTPAHGLMATVYNTKAPLILCSWLVPSVI